MVVNYQTKSHFFQDDFSENHHVKVFIPNNWNGESVFMLHGSMECGTIFYSNSGKGLAPYLASKGYRVLVPDMAGRGLSSPNVGRGSRSNQNRVILEDIPFLLRSIRNEYGSIPDHWVAHSWGGVIMLAHLVRIKDFHPKSVSFLGTKRRISVINLRRLFAVDVVWTFIGEIMSSILGYFPARKMGIGAENEPSGLYRDTRKWVYSHKWIDPTDGFNYDEEFSKSQIPPTLYIAGINDSFLGNPVDVQLLMESANGLKDHFMLLSRHNGHKLDYGHINMCTSRYAVVDHFPEIVNWMKKHTN